MVLGELLLPNRSLLNTQACPRPLRKKRSSINEKSRHTTMSDKTIHIYWRGNKTTKRLMLQTVSNALNPHKRPFAIFKVSFFMAKEPGVHEGGVKLFEPEAAQTSQRWSAWWRGPGATPVAEATHVEITPMCLPFPANIRIFPDFWALDASTQQHKVQNRLMTCAVAGLCACALYVRAHWDVYDSNAAFGARAHVYISCCSRNVQFLVFKCLWRQAA